MKIIMNKSHQNRESAIIKKPSGESWNEFCDLLKAAGQFVVDNSAEDELERSEGFRYLARLLANSLQDAVEPPSLKPPTIQYRTTRIGADNPDFVYASVPIRGTLTYRISGRLNDCYQFNIGAFHGRLGTAEGLQSTGFLNQNDLQLDDQGSLRLLQVAKLPSRMRDSGCHFVRRQTVLSSARLC